MARQRSDEYEGVAAQEELVRLRQEVEALRREKAELAALAAATGTAWPQSAETPPPPAGARAGLYWAVTLVGCIRLVVEAADAVYAVRRYNEEMGVISSESSPVVEQSGREEYRKAQARRFGVRES